MSSLREWRRSSDSTLRDEVTPSRVAPSEPAWWPCAWPWPSPARGAPSRSPPPRQAPPAGGAQAAPVQSPIEIEHQAPACVAAGKYARLDACFRPASQLARARVYFRAFGSKDWFYVEMKRDMPCHHGTLPRPKKDIGRIEYYISATDRRSSEARTKDATLLVTVGRTLLGRSARAGRRRGRPGGRLGVGGGAARIRDRRGSSRRC